MMMNETQNGDCTEKVLNSARFWHGTVGSDVSVENLCAKAAEVLKDVPEQAQQIAAALAVEVYEQCDQDWDRAIFAVMDVSARDRDDREEASKSVYAALALMVEQDGKTKTEVAS